MARPRKINTDALIRLIDDYFVNECRREPARLKYAKIAKYIRMNGYAIEDYDIRRSNKAVGHINQLKEKTEEAIELSICVYKTLDVDEFLTKNNSLSSLKKALIQREQYYSDVAASASFYMNNYKKLEQTVSKISDELAETKSINQELNAQNQEMKEKIKALQDKVITITNILNTNVYPEIANELLSMEGNLIKGKSITISNIEKNVIGDNLSFDEIIKKNEKLKSTNVVIQDLFNKI